MGEINFDGISSIFFLVFYCISYYIFIVDGLRKFNKYILINCL